MRACLFDLDGVLTDTASVHTKAWKAMFDAYLASGPRSTGEEFVPSTRLRTTASTSTARSAKTGSGRFWTAAESSCPKASPTTPPMPRPYTAWATARTTCSRKSCTTTASRCSTGRGAIWRRSSAAGLGIAVVSSSANTREVLEITGLDRFIQQRVDGVTLRDEHIAGKPAPDSFLRAAQLLDVPADAAAVFEDALSGVQAGRAGNFGFVVGVDRVGQAEDLRHNGADVVVTDLAELLQS